MGTCWWCHWGWPREIAEIYLRAEKDIDEAILNTATEANDWHTVEEPLSGEYALEYGPAHVVWSDENWDLAESCLKDCDDPLHADWFPPALEIVKRSLRELAALPEELKRTPKGYDGEHPENYPPPPEWEMARLGEGKWKN